MTDLLLTREVADWLGVSRDTVLRWMRRGELPGVRLPGNRIRFRRDQVEAWLEARTDEEAKVGASIEMAGRRRNGPDPGIQEVSPDAPRL